MATLSPVVPSAFAIDGAEGAYLNPDLARHLAGLLGNFVYPTSRREFGVLRGGPNGFVLNFLSQGRI